MPIKHAALKQIRKDRKRTTRNQAVESELKTLKKRLLTLLAAKQHAEASKLLPTVMRRFDQAAAKGIIHRKTASRTASRLMQRLNSGTASTPAAPARVGGSSAPSS